MSFKTFVLIFFLTASALLMFSCRHNPDIPALPAVSFSSDVQTILIGNCTQSGCHGAGSDRRRFSLVTYDDVINSGTINPGDGHNSNLFKAIVGRNNIMPKAPQAPLSDTQISTIYLWIEQGAKNN